MENLIGQTINGYEIREMIGKGGYGAIYKAVQSSVNREVALKVIQPRHAANQEFARRFELEAKVIAELEHLYIVPLYEYWQSEDGMFIAMRWLRGGSAHDSLKKEGPWSLERTRAMIDHITDALSVAHQAGIVHRDIKPGNILLDERGNCFLGDFGIAKRLNDTAHITDPRAVLGSPAYLSPEQILGEPVTVRTDIYGLGITVYELLSGHHPFSGIDMMRMVVKQLQDPVPDVHQEQPSISAAVNAVIQKATSKKTEERYETAAAFADAFRTAVDEG